MLCVILFSLSGTSDYCFFGCVTQSLIIPNIDRLHNCPHDTLGEFSRDSIIVLAMLKVYPRKDAFVLWFDLHQGLWIGL